MHSDASVEQASTMVEVLKRFYVAETAYLGSDDKDFSIVAPTLHPDCVVLHPQSLPYAGRWVGHEGVERWLRAFGDTWSALEVTDPVFYPSGSDTVFVRCHVRAVARATGTEIDWPMLQMITIRDRLIGEIEPFMWDTAATLEKLRPQT
ncbi:nuclear transport factor 2 family protein [Mycolicibacterium smegmatis]|uniref:SnoaL-like domain-containing protein n=3 Tax=Mycolicibacterium smegmatis TaxID=1772 RepID=I7FCV7_MYCS2|nr:nuclear transport factor 2 family protein [Mycolicibacterium smegmatis]ABK71102.1 conserved hypothetical protein [Mycolicibacterium smegmatis MC2 155]AFP39345.1 hypothetical protein MSMEI_2881 [Mycolicibacterium smegmatis MC2 155]AIU08112.1 hypothetical protein LJ00_14705 [Mycolicibacterium smegmatis MC2 155]AIU14737.1 hypothetical protein LI99_14710 [Mycolicibacterium smegmatis]AIU21360.1 hypothetical protein LI98_14715 [Mycolicibacterium smegmatis]